MKEDLVSYLKGKGNKVKEAIKNTLGFGDAKFDLSNQIDNSKVIACIVSASLLMNVGANVIKNFVVKKQNEKVIEELLNRQDESINIWSYNLKADYLAEKDNAEKYSWDNRKEAIVNQIETEKPDIIGVQELTPNMYNYLCSELENYAGNIQKRYDDREKNFGQGFFYNKDRFLEIESGKFYLSETPDEFSVGWDKDVRICAWIKLYDKLLDREFYVFNAHYTTHNISIHKRSSELILERTQDLDAPVILLGDFNCTKWSPAYKTIMEGYDDASVMALRNTEKGTTFQNYDFLPDYLNFPIDFIMSRTQNGVPDFVVLDYDIKNEYTREHLLDIIFDDAQFAYSDHNAIGSTVYFNDSDEKEKD